MRVLGVDGCKDGWAVVALEDGRVRDIRIVTSIADLVEDAAVVIAIDTPMGEACPGDRRAEREARAYLSAHKSRVFTPPPIASLTAATYLEACAMAEQVCGKRISLQAWNLRDKIIDASRVWRSEPERIREVHPECSFRAIAGHALRRKHDWQGIWERLRVLQSVGIDLLGVGLELPEGAKADDVVDAAAAAWTAARIARGEAFSLPSTPEYDVAGRPVAIWV